MEKQDGKPLEMLIWPKLEQREQIGPETADLEFEKRVIVPR
jgi:hypothetical protein